MKKSGLADSPFFTVPQPAVPTAASPPPPARKTGSRKAGKPDQKQVPSEKPPPTERPARHEVMPPRDHATVVARYHDTIIELVRKAVKVLGKEAATHRFTEAEKQAVADIIYTYKGRGIRTSENEVTRIAVNFILHDYQENGENSVLEQVLKALHE